MDLLFVLLTLFVVWRVLCLRYQKAHIHLLSHYLASLQLEKHIETLTQGYLRAISSETESRQHQIFEALAPSEQAVASQTQSLATKMESAAPLQTRIGVLPFCLPYIEHIVPSLTRDFRELLRIHAAGIQHVVDNEMDWSPKDRAFHLSAELYLFQNSCHWFCKSRNVANARLQLQHKVTFDKTLASVSERTRSAYQNWLHQV
ncbi:MAG TPA: hypothetical protein K8U84_09905 [Paenalcaligenes hominis]|uniref:Uncharacterized protein n=1 Tax=Paenalcaligenes hominis TaxID=643674 RepID=A0A9D2VHY5_9BURK|nr:hypothetical protein [Paenalcaligenes hominis]